MALSGYIKTNLYGVDNLGGLSTWTEREFEAVERALRDLADGTTTEINNLGTGSGILVDIYATPGTYTWTKSSGAIALNVTVVAGGGSGGGGGIAAGDVYGSGGGGGGCWFNSWLNIDSVGATETVVVGPGGAGGAGSTASSYGGSAGNAGGLSCFGNHIKCYGGGAGNGTQSGGAVGGGGGGSMLAAGNAGDASAGSSSGFGAAVPPAWNGSPADNATHGGAAGGSGVGNTSGAPTDGGKAIQGGQGGGGGAGDNETGGDAYHWGWMTTVSGGAAGANGSAATGIASSFRGAGGGGGGGTTGSGTAGNGGAGQQPGGGGGGGGSVSSASGTPTSGTGGDGGDGIVFVVTWTCAPVCDTTEYDTPLSACRSRPAAAAWDAGGAEPYKPYGFGIVSTNPGFFVEILMRQNTGAYTAANETFTGASGQAPYSDYQMGYFNNGYGVFGIEKGVVVSTGNVGSIGTFLNNSGGQSSNISNTTFGNDSDLAAIQSGTQYDRATLEFDFTPTVDGVLQFKFCYASDEYPPSSYTDVVGIFIDGTNVALVNGSPLKTSTVNATTNSEYYVDNSYENFGYPNMPYPKFYFSGFTINLSSTPYSVTAGNTYHIKIAIADLSDWHQDTALFIEEGAFTTDDQCVEVYTGSSGISVTSVAPTVSVA